MLDENGVKAMLGSIPEAAPNIGSFEKNTGCKMERSEFFLNITN
jgi:hypothetical protein